MPKRTASATWNGTLQDGDGTMRMASGAYEGPYSFQSRFEEGDGTNPEELIAAAHAGCFSMALSAELGKAGHNVETVQTDAIVHLDKVDAAFQEVAEAAKKGCPVSRHSRRWSRSSWTRSWRPEGLGALCPEMGAKDDSPRFHRQLS